MEPSNRYQAEGGILVSYAYIETTPRALLL